MGDPAARLISAVYGVAGLAFGSVLEPWLSNKKPVKTTWAAGIIVVVLLLLVLNVRMYLQARKPVDAEFAPPAFERWMRPIFATVSFLVGASILVLSAR